jgi:hypothetical protein
MYSHHVWAPDAVCVGILLSGNGGKLKLIMVAGGMAEGGVGDGIALCMMLQPRGDRLMQLLMAKGLWGICWVRMRFTIFPCRNERIHRLLSQCAPATNFAQFCRTSCIYAY